MAEAGTTPFVMHGARDAMAGGLAHIERHIIAIESAVVEEPALAFDLAKTLIEAVCKAVLDQRSVGYTNDDDLPFRASANCGTNAASPHTGRAKRGQ